MQYVLPFPGRLPDSTVTETAGQREAVSSWRRGDICVMAGPGSGKTRVLVERFRWLVAEKGVDPRSILAITFTEKAANNMRERLVNSAVEDAAARQAFQRAPISTIHAFCAQMIREHALEIGLDPEFSVMEEWEFALERRRMIEEVLERMHTDQPAATEQFLRSFPGFDVHGTIERIYESMRASDGTPFAEAPSQASDNEWMRHLEELRRLLPSPELDEFAGRLDTVESAAKEELALLDELAQFLDGLSAAGPGQEALDSLRQSSLPRRRAVVVDSLHQPCREWLAAAVKLVEESYAARKRSVAKLDFNDLERFAVRLLENRPQLRKRFPHVLVDEFQDTNPIQSKLISLLRPSVDGRQSQRGVRALSDEEGSSGQPLPYGRGSDEGASEERALFAVGDGRQPERGEWAPLDEEGGSGQPLPHGRGSGEGASGEGASGEGALFAVGDINQSIYGFRHAAPEVFRRYRGDLKAHGGHIVELQENFRSRPDILSAVEVILAGEDGIDPRSLVASRNFGPKEMPSVEVLFVRHLVKEAVLRQEALHVAARIAQLRRELRVGKAARAPKWSDFAVLLRTRKLIEEFAAGFRQAGIPYQLSAGRGFYDAPEVRDLTHFLRILVNPRDEISMAAVLCSPLVGITDGAMLRLKENADNLADGLLSDTNQEPEDQVRLEKFRRQLEKFRQTRDDVSPNLLLSRIIAETGYETCLWSQPTGGHQVANIRKFSELLRRVSQKSGLSFDQVVARVEELRVTESPEAEAAVHDEAADAVHVMTLHAAKGLEFPIVFLAALNRRSRGMTGDAGYHATRGIGAKWKDPLTGEPTDDPVFAAIRSAVVRREAEETNRLFYVAMTRAEEHLVLSASCGQLVRATQWAKLIRDKLRLDFKQIDSVPQERQLGGLRFRLLQTDQSPELSAISPEPGAQETANWLEPLDPPEDQSDSAVAVTSIALYSQCPRRYYLSRYLGFGRTVEAATVEQKARLEGPETGRRQEMGSVPSPDAPSPDREGGVSRFDAPHPTAATLPSLLAARPGQATELGKRVHAILAGSQPPDAADTKVMEWVRGFQESELGKRVPADARHEQNLLFALDGHLLRGQVDLWFDEGGERVLVDYKTDQLKPEEVAGRASEYELQLQLYARAIEQATGRRPDRAVLYFLRPNVAVDVDAGADAIKTATDRVKDFFAAQSRINFPLNAGEHCYRCPHYRNICPANVPAPRE